jgi:hypothetical protein
VQCAFATLGMRPENNGNIISLQRRKKETTHWERHQKDINARAVNRTDGSSSVGSCHKPMPNSIYPQLIRLGRH